ncbi:MAG: IclR family transcriptional regulator [Burkholderiaceae bacterium]|nr:IclR family transcriptional regulator [Burkholderiaceae bacterium]
MNSTPEQNDNGADKYTVPGLERGLRLLCEFSRHERSLSAPELAKRLDVPRSTVFRLLSTLERMGFIERNEGGRDYKLGMAVLRLGFEYLASLELTEIGRPLLERLRDEIQYSTCLVVRDQRSIVYVAKATMPEPFVTSVNVGTRLPAHATVLGRILLQDMTLPQLRELYPDEQLKVYSKHTPKTVQDLFSLVQADRERSYVYEEGFLERGICTVAAPVRDHGGNIVAALGITIPKPHIAANELDYMVAQVCMSAAELSRLLDHAPSPQAAVTT